MNEEKCSNCRFSTARDYPGQNTAHSHEKTICRRQPPAADERDVASRFPIVKPGSWCGEWASKPMSASKP